jgi:phospholipase/carboxylesterase
MSETLSFIHRFEKGATPDARPLLLLHGTGGDENDLLPLGRAVASGAPLLSPRGKVLENGMPRFFRRSAEGVFDEDDVRRRALELADFVEEAHVRYGIMPPIALGYSNGANVAAAVLLLRPEILGGAMLLRATVPLAKTQTVDLAGKQVLIVAGAADPLIPPEKTQALAALLRGQGAAVEYHALPIGHQLSPTDVDLARAWMQAHGK